MQKTIQHYRVTLDQAKRDYQDGLLTATGLVFYAIAILRPPGQKLRIKNIGKFIDDLGISAATFYRVLSKLKLKGRIGWEPMGDLVLWTEVISEVVSIADFQNAKSVVDAQTVTALSLSHIRDTDSQIRDTDSQIREFDSQIREFDSQIREFDSQIREFDGSKLAPSKESGDPSYSYQIFIKSLSNSEREKFEKFVDRKIEALPYKIALRRTWIGKNLEELAEEFRRTTGNRRSINLPDSEQIARLQQMKDAGEIKDFYLSPWENAQTIVVDDRSEVRVWWEFLENSE